MLLASKLNNDWADLDLELDGVEYAKCEDRYLLIGLTQESLHIMILDVARMYGGPFIFIPPSLRNQVNALKICFGTILMIVSLAIFNYFL